MKTIREKYLKSFNLASIGAQLQQFGDFAADAATSAIEELGRIAGALEKLQDPPVRDEPEEFKFALSPHAATEFGILIQNAIKDGAKAEALDGVVKLAEQGRWADVLLRLDEATPAEKGSVRSAFDARLDHLDPPRFYALGIYDALGGTIVRAEVVNKDSAPASGGGSSSPKA